MGELLPFLFLILLPFILCEDDSSLNNIEDKEYKNYTGYQIVQLSPQNEDHLHFIGQLENSLGFELDVLRAVNRIGSHSEVLVPPNRIREVLNSLNHNQLPHEVAVDNVGSIISRDRRALSSPPGQFDPFRYYSYQDQMRILDSIVARRLPFVQSGSLGFSLQKRPLKYLKFGYPSPNFKPVLFIDAGFHAREWIAPATALYVAYKLSNDRSYDSLLRVVDIFIVPNMNPDGYEFSRNKDRMWRKTRSGPRGMKRCFGVDPNRNFPFFFGFDGTSSDPCSDIFLGENPLNEAETAALARFLLTNRRFIRGYVTLHSYGGNILYPWGYKQRTYPEDVKDLKWAGNRMANAIAKIRGTRYKVDNAADGLYAAAGASDDYAKSIGIKYAFTIELRPLEGEILSARGFELPQQEIRSTVIEAFEGIIEMARIIQEER